MDGYAVCHALVADAVNRCKHSNTLCRVTVCIKPTANLELSAMSFFMVSISDTGQGIGHEDFIKHFKMLQSHHPKQFNSAPQIWGGELLVITTALTEEVVRQYHVHDAFHKPKVVQHGSITKAQRYSGTDVTVHLEGIPEKLLHYMQDICKKAGMLMLKVQKHVPDLAKCIATLISSSSNAGFKNNCADMLRLNSADLGDIEQEIKARVLRSIEVFDLRCVQAINQKSKNDESSCEDQNEDSTSSRNKSEWNDNEGYNGQSIWEYL